MYQYLKIEYVENVAYLYLNHPKLNTLNLDFLKEIEDAIKFEAANPQVFALVIASQVPKFFSNGLDPKFMLDATLAEREAVFRQLNRMALTFVGCQKPTLALIEGHCMAGGAVIAACCDFRMMTESDFKISFSELKVGLYFPKFLQKILATVVSQQAMLHLILRAEVFNAQKALAYGFVDSVYPADSIKAEVHNFLQPLRRIDQNLLHEMKASLKKDLLAEIGNYLEEDLTITQKYLGDGFEEGLLSVIERRPAQFKNAFKNF